MNKVLARQLKKLGLNESMLPSSIDSWRDFLKKIDHYYTETDSDRYRLERSMDISSNEMQELNTKLQTAQDMAELGYWSHNLSTDENIWSLKMFDLFGLDLACKVPSIEEMFKQIHPEHFEDFKKSYEEAISSGKPYNIQLRLRPFNHANFDDYRWYQIICEPCEYLNGKYTKLAGIVMDITDRRTSELEIERLNSQLLDTARRAGMSEIATSMLHNVGNILNSANTTAEWMKQELDNIIYDRIVKLSELISEHKDHLADFLTKDIAGKKIPEYMIALNQRITHSNLQLKREAESLLNHLNHISKITSMHKSTSGVSGIESKISILSAINEALAICDIDLKRNDIHLIKNIGKDIALKSDKHKIIQILINLIKNSIEALTCFQIPHEKIITIDVKNEILNDENLLILSVTDNGVGIEADTLKQLFKFGFTTKKNGHGFGLHGSALNAKELHAKLTAESNGRMQGAKFTLAIKLHKMEGVI